MLKKSQIVGELPIVMSFVFLFFAAPLWAQTSTAPARVTAFEVASIRSAAPLDMRQAIMGQQRVGMKVDAARVDIANLSLVDLIRIAYRVKPYQIAGPDWMKGARFDIVAKLPVAHPRIRRRRCFRCCSLTGSSWRYTARPGSIRCMPW